MTDRYFIAVWQRPSKANGSRYGEASLYATEDAIVREAEDYGFEPESVVEMVREPGKAWQSIAFQLDMDRIHRDRDAERRQETPHYG